MTGVITEKNYPIQKIWIFKPTFISLFFISIFIFNFIISASFVIGFLIETKKIEKSFKFLSAPETLIGFDNKYNKLKIFPLIAFILFILLTLLPVVIYFIIRAFLLANFHYSFEEKSIVFQQGIISKQTKILPYQRIQNVILTQGLFERFFGLASLIIEDIAGGLNLTNNSDRYYFFDPIGFIKNKAIIPGLKKEDAEKLKEIILQKIKENMDKDSQSGL